MLKDGEKGEGWLGRRRGSSSGPSGPGSYTRPCTPTDLETERERGGETCRYCRNQSTSFVILRVISHGMIQCTDGGSRGGDALRHNDKTRLGRLRHFARDAPHNPNFKGSFLGRKTPPPQPNTTVLPAPANSCWALSAESSQHLAACCKETKSREV